MVRFQLLCLFLFSNYCLFAQRKLPVKLGHQWTFLSLTDSTIINNSASYDNINYFKIPWFGFPDSKSSFYLVEKNNNLGLLNDSFEEVLAPNWKEIHPINSKHFLVFDKGYTIVNEKAQDLLDGKRYTYIKFAKDTPKGTDNHPVKMECFNALGQVTASINLEGSIEIPIYASNQSKAIPESYEVLTPRGLALPKDKSGYFTPITLEKEYDTLELDQNTRWIKNRTNYQLAKYIKVRKRDKGKKGKKHKTTKVEYEFKWRKKRGQFLALKSCHDVNWTLAIFNDAGLVSNELTQLSKNNFQARKMTIFLNDSKKFVPDLQIIGIRLADFKMGLSYAAFLDLNGKMGLIDKKGNQLLAQDGKPARFCFIGTPSEGKIRVCQNGCALRNIYRKQNVPSYSKLLTDFHLEIKDAHSISRQKTTSNFQKPNPTWGYFDESFHLVIPFLYREGSNFIDSFAINTKGSRQGIINHKNKIVIPFKYDKIIDEGQHWRVSQKKIKTNPLFFDNKGRRFPDEERAKAASQEKRLSTGQKPDFKK